MPQFSLRFGGLVASWRVVLVRLIVSARLLRIFKPRLSMITPTAVGLALFLAFPTPAAYQDIASMVSGAEAGSARWNAFVEKAVAGSVHAAEMPFADSVATGAISGSGMRAPGVGAVALRGQKTVVADTPDESRVNRAEKRGRIVVVAPVAPPRNFNAGSVVQRTSMLLRPSVGDDVRMVFARPQIRGKEVQIATAFYPKEQKPKSDPLIPAALAALVTNDRPDVLATAYAPADPNYAKRSPFESLLQDGEGSSGRFIPPVVDGDHGWMSTPLPAAVFGAAEQKCLATAIYFEARGESLRGQAAVAQVVLNRVRNPAYPKTVCGVVYQNDGMRNACQFSFACDGIRDRVTNPSAYRMAQDIALAVTSGKIFISDIGSSTNYHATYVKPRWARTMEKMKKIGLHIFYRTYGGGWI